MNRSPSHRPGLPALAALLLPVLAGALLAWSGRPLLHRTGIGMVPFHAATARQLIAVLDGYDYTWPPRMNVPALELAHFPPGLEALQPPARKDAFLRSLLPLVIAANNLVNGERREIRSLLDTAGHTGHWPTRLQQLASRYDIEPTDNTVEAAKLLLRRCNTVPAALVLAQAAKESGWGTSRFALRGNNLFGMHTWNPHAGLAADGSSHPLTDRVRSYPDLLASVRDYVYNLNVGYAYVAFRDLREREQASGRMNSIALARTLGSYSELGERYVRHLQQLIRQNRLQSLPRFKLRPAIP